jgi:hypothetical protein
MHLSDKQKVVVRIVNVVDEASLRPISLDRECPIEFLADRVWPEACRAFQGDDCGCEAPRLALRISIEPRWRWRTWHHGTGRDRCAGATISAAAISRQSEGKREGADKNLYGHGRKNSACQFGWYPASLLGGLGCHTATMPQPMPANAQHCGTFGLKLANIPAGLCSNSQMWNIHTSNPSLRVNGMPKNAGGSALCHFSKGTV